MDNEIKADVVKFEMMKEDLKNLLMEFAQSYDVHLDFAFNDLKLMPDRQGRPRVFDLKVNAFAKSQWQPDASTTVSEIAGEYAVYETYWKRWAVARGLDLSLLGKIIEVESGRQHRLARYKVLGLNTKKRIKYCVAMQDIDTGKTYRGAVIFVNGGKVIG